MLEFVGLVLTLAVVIYAVSKGMIADLARPYVAMLVNHSPAAPAEIMSHSPDVAPSDGAASKDGRPDGRTDAPIAPALRPATLDTARSLRAHGYTRDEARALLRGLGWTLGNDVWAAAQPAPSAPADDDDTLVTPWAGRRTRASYYPDAPELEYQEPTT